MYRQGRQLSSDEVPLSPMPREYEEQEEVDNETAYTPHSQPMKPTPAPPARRQNLLSNDRHVMFLLLAIMSLVFLILNVVQIALIFRISSYFWTLVLPGVLLLCFVAFFAFEAYRRRTGLRASWAEADRMSFAMFESYSTVRLTERQWRLERRE